MPKHGRRRIHFPEPLHCVACLRFVRIPHRTCTRKHFCSDECVYWARVIIPKTEDYEDRCWGWEGVRNHFGHAYSRRLTPDSKGRHCGVSAHSVSYELFCGPVPKGMVVRHLCDTRDCTNPNHLAIGTYQQNTKDMMEANRWRAGRKHRAALTTEQVLEIFHAEGQYKEIAKKYDVSAPTIGSIKNGHTHWKKTGLPRLQYGVGR